MLETQPKGWMEGDEEIMQEGGEMDGEKVDQAGETPSQIKVK